MPDRYFALREKSKNGSLSFICAARDIEEHRKLVADVYRTASWGHWCDHHDGLLTFEQFMERYDELQVIVVEN